MILFADRAYPFADRVLALLAFASALKGVGRPEWQCGTTGRWRPPARRSSLLSEAACYRPHFLLLKVNSNCRRRFSGMLRIVAR